MTPFFCPLGPLLVFTSLGSSALAPCLFFSAYCSHRCSLPQIQRESVCNTCEPGTHGSMWSGPPCFSDLISCLVFSAGATLASLLFLISTASFYPRTLALPVSSPGLTPQIPGALDPLLWGSAPILERLSHLSALCKEEPHSPLHSLAPALSFISLCRTWPCCHMVKTTYVFCFCPVAPEH